MGTQSPLNTYAMYCDTHIEEEGVIFFSISSDSALQMILLKSSLLSDFHFDRRGREE